MVATVSAILITFLICVTSQVVTVSCDTLRLPVGLSYLSDRETDQQSDNEVNMEEIFNRKNFYPLAEKYSEDDFIKREGKYGGHISDELNPNLWESDPYMLRLRQLLERRPDRRFAKRQCYVGGGTSNNCDNKLLVDSVKHSQYLNTIDSPGRRRR